MSGKKYTIICILFLVVMPFKVMFGQEVSADTTESELDIRYDSIMTKAAKAFSDSSYKEAVDYYKEASAIKPQESYPLKMIIYVEATSRDAAAKQKRADDIRRKTQIQQDFAKANNAIVEKNWAAAKSLFNEVLTLHPEKADEDYAKSKIQAIDLELQRIALRTPVKEEPKPVYVPKNKREARAMRKQAERNAILAAGANSQVSQKPVAATGNPPAPATTSINNNPNTNSYNNINPKTTTAVRPAAATQKTVSYQILQHFNEDFKDVSNVNWTISSDYYKADFIQDEEKVEAFYDTNGVLIGTSRHISTSELPRDAKKILATKYGAYTIKEVIRYEGAEESAYYISTQNDREKVVFKLKGSRDIAVFSRGAADKNTLANVDLNKATPVVKEAPAVKSTVTSPLPATTVQRQTVVQPQDKKLPATTSSSVVSAPQQTVANPNVKTTPPPALPAKAQQVPAAVQSNNVAIATAPIKETTGQQAATQKTVTTTPVQQQPVSGTLPDKNNLPQTPTTPGKKIAEVPAARNTTTPAALPGQSSQPATAGSLPDRRIANAPTAKEIQPRPSQTLPAETTATNLPVPDVNTEPKKTGLQGLNLSDSSDYIKLICQDISFIGSNVYTKVLIQNYSEYTEFATDTLLVSLKKNDGKIVRLDQRFISTFPVIEPLGEYVLVSLADAPETIASDDIFIIQMKNKRQQSKLTIQVPWGKYSQSKSF